MGLHFIAATEQHIPLIVSLAQKIWREHYPSLISTEQIEYMLATRYAEDTVRHNMKQGERYFIAYSGNTPVAYAAFEERELDNFLGKFYVEVSRHRKGIGKRFFNFLLTQCNAAKPFRLQVNRQNFKAVNFYFKMGFVIESVGDFDIGSGYFMNDFVMIRV